MFRTGVSGIARIGDFTRRCGQRKEPNSNKKVALLAYKAIRPGVDKKATAVAPVAVKLTEEHEECMRQEDVDV